MNLPWERLDKCHQILKGIYDTKKKKNTIKIMEVPYSIEQTQAWILKNEQEDFLIQKTLKFVLRKGNKFFLR